MMMTLKATAFRGDVSVEQMMALLVVAEQYHLNPFTKEIYAFPDPRNGIVPIVGVDGWLRMVNENANFDGMEFVDGPQNDKGVPEWIECKIFRKDRQHAIAAREYFAECYRDKGPAWQSHPRRMLRHKALIQAARMAFGFVGIYEEDEGQRILEASVVAEQSKGDSSGRVDTSQVDPAIIDRWVGQITDILAQDKDEFTIAEHLRDANAEMSKFADVATAVFDALASRKIISKANYRKYLRIERPAQ
jgi:phage recombination protein Bet